MANVDGEVHIETPIATDVAAVPDPALRSALEFAVGIASEGQKLRPPLAFPAGLKPLFRMQRLDRPALRTARRVLVSDSSFRERLASVATPDLVDEVGIIWLQRPDGWQQRLATLMAEFRDAAEEATAEAAVRKAERRREAAELAAARAHAELLGQHDSIAREQLRRERAEETAASAQSEITGLRSETGRLRRDVENLTNRLAAESARAERAESAVAELTEKVRIAETMRDEALASRVAPVVIAADGPGFAEQTNREAARALQSAAAATRELAQALATASEALATGPQQTAPRPHRPPRDRHARRKPIPIPGGVYGDSVAATLHLLRTPNAAVIVDGYNVAKLAWPHLELADQRECCIDLLEDVVRRHGTEIHVVFDGADVTGASAGRRRLVRVQYSPLGVIADDVIRAEVAAMPAQTPVVVVTNDQAIVNDVRAAGANVVASDALLAAAGRRSDTA